MTKLFLFTTLLLAIQNLNCQELKFQNSNSNQEMYDFHYEKHKKQKKTGFILLGSGIAVFFGGGLIGANNNLEFGGVAMTAGALTSLSSIPVFIISGSNKRKANLYVSISANQELGLSSSKPPLTTVGIKIEIGSWPKNDFPDH